MGDFKVITWNMRGLSLQGDEDKKVELLYSLIHACLDDPERPQYPVLFLQEAGNLEKKLQENPFWANNYTWKFSPPVGAFNMRCTTGLMIPGHLTIKRDYTCCLQASEVRNYVTASIWGGEKAILLASIHAVASGSAAADNRAMLDYCCKNDYFVAGGDFNCSPEDMEAEKQFTERLREKGFVYDVREPLTTTHRTASTGEERQLDYLCVKGLSSSCGDRLFGSEKRSEEPYSDHWPICYVVSY